MKDVDRVLAALDTLVPQQPGTLSRKCGLPRRHVQAICHRDPRIKRCTSPERRVGSSKSPGTLQLYVAPDKDFELM